MTAPLPVVALPYAVPLIPVATGYWELRIPPPYRNNDIDGNINHELRADSTLTVTYDGPEGLAVHFIRGAQPRRRIASLPAGPAGVPRTTRPVTVGRGGLTSLIQVILLGENGEFIPPPQSSIDEQYVGTLSVYPLTTYSPTTM